jgi:transposase InsO family protein
MQRRMDATWGQEALPLARGCWRPAAGLRPPSDRGSPYAWVAYLPLRAEHGLRCSMSRLGEGLAQAGAERFCGSVNGERPAPRHYATRQAARDEVIESIELFDHSPRWHSYWGYVSPKHFERLAKGAALRVRFSLTTTQPSHHLLRAWLPLMGPVRSMRLTS